MKTAGDTIQLQMSSPGEPLASDSIATIETSTSNRSGSSGNSSAVIEILVLVTLTLAVRVPWIFMTPISQAPDEGAHYWVIDFMRANLRLPELTDMMKEPNSAYYGALMPFSYFPHVLCGLLMPWFQPALAYRFGSLLMGVVSVVAARGIGYELFPKSKLVALAVPLFLVFHAQLAFVNGYSNNDSTSMAVSTLALYAALIAVRRGISFKSSIAFGIIGGLLALSKPTTYCIVPVLFLALAMSPFFNRESVRSYASKLATMFSVALVIALPFFARNWFCFNGDLLGMRTMLDLWWSHYGKPAQLYRWPVVDNADWRYCAYVSYIGNLGNMDRLLPSRIYKLFSLGITLSTVGWVIGSVWSFVRKSAVQATERNLSICLWSLVGLSFLLNFLALIAGSASLNATGPPQGRYLFPSEAAIAALLVGGLSKLGRLAVILFIALNMVATIVSLNMLYPVWHFDVNIFR
jgi:4-amino-4-deoxy-L-arabinose transferase-like glycosyltransferase